MLPWSHRHWAHEGDGPKRAHRKEEECIDAASCREACSQKLRDEIDHMRAYASDPYSAGQKGVAQDIYLVFAACARCRVFISRPGILFSCLINNGQRKGNGGRGGSSVVFFILYSTLLGLAWSCARWIGLYSISACVSGHCTYSLGKEPPKEKSQIVL